MKSRIAILVQGEFSRLNKYNLFAANFVVLLMWVLIASFIDGDVLLTFIPIIFLVESTMMTVVLVGATLFYEKKEHTVHSILVTPVTAEEYILSKILAGILNAMITVGFISVALYIIKGVTYNYALIIPGVAVTVAMHTVLGLWMAYGAKNFTTMLVNYILYVFTCLIPPVMVMLDVIPMKYDDWMIILPPEAASVLIGAAVATQAAWKMLFGYAYLLALGAAIYYLVIRPRLADSLMRELGV